mmetsp:Transcript_31237/g.62998  ORF Transcript_31237/g.62998 Transcript_31237/m.62998 type:complete len:118 (+) Transcript_31237:57-410(+)
MPVIFPTFALKAARKATQRRHELADRRAQHKRFIKDVLGTWDASHSGNLTAEEVSKWLSAVSQGQTPTDDEVKWVICMANRKHTQDYENAHRTRSFPTRPGSMDVVQRMQGRDRPRL